MSSKHA